MNNQTNTVGESWEAKLRNTLEAGKSCMYVNAQLIPLQLGKGGYPEHSNYTDHYPDYVNAPPDKVM